MPEFKESVVSFRRFEIGGTKPFTNSKVLGQITLHDFDSPLYSPNLCHALADNLGAL
jgi:hypothetical protein